MLRRILIIALITVLALPTGAQAETSTDAVRTNCASIVISLKELQKRDAVNRTNLGRSFETTARQLAAFSQRLENNKVNAQQFNSLKNEYGLQLDAFRTSYVNYDTALTTLLKIDCSNKPEDFISSLNQARVMRAAVGAEVAHIQDTLGRYQLAIQGFRVQLEQITSQPTGGGQ